VVNFASRFADIRTNVITGPTAGPRRVMNDVEVFVAGAALKRVERVGFLNTHAALWYRERFSCGG